MKRFFGALSLFSLVFGSVKIGFALYSLINPLPLSKLLLEAGGVEGLVGSGSMAKNMSTQVIPFLWGFLVTSCLTVVSVIIMRMKKRTGFYIYLLVNAFLTLFFFYAGFNFFPGLHYLSVFPLIGMLSYIAVLDYFWFPES